MRPKNKYLAFISAFAFLMLIGSCNNCSEDESLTYKITDIDCTEKKNRTDQVLATTLTIRAYNSTLKNIHFQSSKLSNSFLVNNLDHQQSTLEYVGFTSLDPRSSKKISEAMSVQASEICIKPNDSLDIYFILANSSAFYNSNFHKANDSGIYNSYQSYVIEKMKESSVVFKLNNNTYSIQYQ
jgi:hypothetical protein